MGPGRRPSVSAVPIAAVNGIELYYEQRGSGPRVLFVNGSG